MEIKDAILLIKKKIDGYEEDRKNKVGYTGNCDDWFYGIQKGLKDALQIISMIDKNNNRTFLSNKLDKASEEYEDWAMSYSQEDYPTCVSIRQAFKAGAEWMAEQGETIEGTLGYGPHLRKPIIVPEEVPKIWDGGTKSVVINIKEK